MPMIEVQKLTKRYQERVAVNALSFSVGEGEILGFLGPNGAGKSTTMRMLTGFLPPTEGSVRVAGFDVFESPLEVKRRIGYLPETPPLYVEMSVRGYLKFVAALKGVPGRRVAAEVDRVAELTGLTGELGRIIQTLSKGYRQRVGMAQALLGSPPLLILDEPTEGLDPSQRKDVRSLIRGLAGQHTVILSKMARGVGGWAQLELPTARGLSVLRQGFLEGVSAIPLVLSSPFAWLETEPSERPEPSDGEKMGPLPLVVLSTRDTAQASERRSTEARVVVFGDSELLLDANWGHEPNRNLVLNVFGWATSQATRVTIRPPDRDISTVDLDPSTLARIRFISTDMLPLTLLCVGLAVWLARRSQ
jgi:ABC-2 type transport system ATP-binding protein